MKFTADTKDLKAALKAACEVVPARPLRQDYGCVFLHAEDELVDIYAKDQDMELSLSCPANVEECGEALVPAKLLADYVSLADSEVELTLKGTTLTVKSGRKKSTVLCLDTDLFTPAKLDGTPLFTASGEDLAAWINRTSFCASYDESRRAICGVHMEIDPDGITRFVAMDGCRISCCDGRVEADESLVETAELTIPNAVVKQLVSLFGNIEKVSVSLEKYRASVKGGGRELIFPLITSQYVEYGRTIPAGYKTELKLNASELMDAFRLAEIASNTVASSVAKNLVKLEADVQNGHLTVTTNTAVSQAVTAVPCDAWGEDMTIAFNVRYLRDLLAACSKECGEVELGFTTPLGVARMKPLESGANLATYIAPVRTH